MSNTTTATRPTAGDRLTEVWKGSIDDRSRIDAYLVSRGLPAHLVDSIDPAVVRFHPALYYWEADDRGRMRSVGRFPAMLAKVTDATGAGVTIHRTYLDPTGPGRADLADDRPTKKVMTPKTEGTTKGAAIRLAPAGSTLGVAEGIETALAVLTATGMPCWSTLSRNPPPPGSEIMP